ncbi:MAG: glycosyl transferase family 2 [Verrucomicrobiales bacterium]|nr:glycosyl transferase family 2 [Verrucomicrobiales bacterium]
MSNQGLVSVIVPAYNAENFISETLDSALSQTYENIEVIVVDDGSRDLTAAIVKNAARRDRRVKLIRQQNLGVAAARNLAIEKASGDFIAPLDADDVWYPAKVEKQVQSLEAAGPKAGASYCWCISINEKGQVLGLGPKWDLEGEVYQPLVLRNFIGNASVPLFRRDYLQKIGGYNADLRAQQAQGCEDWEICLRVAELGEFRVVKEYLAAYRCYSQSMSYDHSAMAKSYALVLEHAQRSHPEIAARVYRWSKGMFYLYLATKSNACGDLHTSYKWLWRAVRQDWSALLLPWVNSQLLKGTLRWFASPFLRSAWQRIGSFRTDDVLEIPIQEIPRVYEEIPVPTTLWDRIQARRWALITDYRSYCCQ